MGLKLNKTGGSDITEQEPIDAGAYPARIVRIVDLGVQPRRAYKGKDKPPAPHILITYELLDEFCKDEEGEDMEDKPRWITERFPMFSLKADGAISTKRYKALDPTEEHGGDFSLLLGKPLSLTVVNNEGSGQHKGKVFNNVGGVSLMRKKEESKAPELVNEAYMFDLDDPDLEVWNNLEDWLKELIEGGIDFDKTSLASMLEDEDEAEEDEKVTSEEEGEEYEGEGDDW